MSAWWCLHKEVGCTYPGLDRAEGVLDRLAPLAHLLRIFIETVLQRLQNVLVLPSRDPSLLGGGAIGFDGVALARVCLVAAQNQSIFSRDRVVVGEPFSGRTSVNVLLGHIAEVLLAERPLCLCV